MTTREEQAAIERQVDETGVYRARTGAPTKYSREHCERLLDLFSTGGTIATACASFGISKETFFRWVKTQPEFAEAYKLAQVKAEAWMVARGLEMMNQPRGLHNDNIWKFMMQNVHGWREKSENTTTRINVDVQTEAVPANRAAERLAALAERLKALPASEAIDVDFTEED